MGTFRLTKKTKADLKIIAAHTQRKWGKTQRLFYIKQLDDAFHLLAENPKLGIKCDYIKKGYHKHPSGGHIVFYPQIDDSLIEIVRVLHRRMDALAHLENS